MKLLVKILGVIFAIILAIICFSAATWLMAKLFEGLSLIVEVPANDFTATIIAIFALALGVLLFATVIMVIQRIISTPQD